MAPVITTVLPSTPTRTRAVSVLRVISMRLAEVLFPASRTSCRSVSVNPGYPLRINAVVEADIGVLGITVTILNHLNH